MSRPTLLRLLLIAALTTSALAKTENWIEVRTPHFVVLCNSNEKQARHVADQFERMRFVFHKVFPNARVDPGSPIIVLAIKDKKDFQALEPEAYLARDQLNLAGLFLRAPDKNYVLLRLDAGGEHPYATVYHEYTHLISSRAEEWLPLWLNEGLAQFYENTDIHDKEVLLGQVSSGALYLLQRNELLPLQTLLTVDHNSPYYHEENKGSIFYAEAWALTHYLSVKDYKEKSHRLTDYVELVGKHGDPVTSATQAFGDLKKLQSDLTTYLAQGSIGYFQMSGGTDVDDSTFKVQALALSQVDAVRADFLAYNRRTKDARVLLDRILHEDPNNVAAHETMGFLAFQDGKLDEAQRWYEQAVKFDSQSFLAHYYFATIAMREVSPSPDRQAQIEASLRASAKLNPNFAPAFDQLAAFFAMQHKNLQEAHTLTLMAVQLDPSNVGFRMNAANVLMEMERSKDAVSVLQNAMKLAITPEQTASIQSQLESIQRYQQARDQEDQRSRQFAEEFRSQGNTSAQGTETLAVIKPDDHPEDDRHGPRHTVKGTLHNVECVMPSTIRLKVESTGKPVLLRSRNYYKIPFSALNFTPTGDLNPCKDLEGMKAKVEFFEGLNESAEGQIISIELTR
jgi:tetratricopeptide (TPR) repeat protein